jgi:hypothetical protein
MNKRIQLLSFLFLLLLASAASAQTPLGCGIVSIDGPSEGDSGPPLVFKVKITGMIHTTKPEFKWTVSAGTITHGQGTDQITLDTMGLGGQVVTTTVKLYGAPAGCTDSASQTMHVKPAPITCGRPFDEYGDIKFEDEEARLDSFAIQLQNDPMSGGLIRGWAGQETFQNEAAERLARAKSHLADVREIDPNRIVLLDCGFRKDLTMQLFVVPVGAPFPVCDDSISVPSYEVKFTKPRPADDPSEIKISGVLVVTIKNGDFVYPTFSPDAKRLAYSRVIRRKDFESTEVLLYDLNTHKQSVLLNSKKAETYATYKVFVSGMQWQSKNHLQVSVGDGDVGGTDLIFDPVTRKLLKETNHSFDDEDITPSSPDDEKDFQHARRLFPSFPEEISRLKKSDSTGMNRFEVKHVSASRVIFLMRTHAPYERGDNPLFVFDGSKLLRVKDYA